MDAICLDATCPNCGEELIRDGVPAVVRPDGREVCCQCDFALRLSEAIKARQIARQTEA